jgi:hypothetical protein
MASAWFSIKPIVSSEMHKLLHFSRQIILPSNPAAFQDKPSDFVNLLRLLFDLSGALSWVPKREFTAL